MSIKNSLFINAIPFSPPLGKVFGVCAALLIQQIHYWCSKQKNIRNEHSWVYKTHKGWEGELLCFDQKTIQRALDSLRVQGVVVAENFNKHRYDRTIWYRVNTEKLMALLHENMPMWTFSLLPSGQIVHTLLDTETTPIPKTTQETTDETTAVDFATEKPPRIKIILGKQTTSEMGLNPMKQPTSSAAILAALKVSNGVPAPVNTSKSIQSLWRTLVPKHHPTVGMLPEFTVVKKGQLAHIVKVLGSSTDSVVGYVLPNWIGYCNFVASQAGLKKTPDVPEIGFLLKYVGEAASYAKENLQLIAPKKKPLEIKIVLETVAVKPVKAEVPLHPEDDEIASAEFMMNWKPPID